MITKHQLTLDFPEFEAKIHDLKVNEIAVITGKSRFSVRYRINSALSTIKNKLNGSDYIEKTIRK